MTIREMYEATGADYDDVLARLMGKEELVKRLVLKYDKDPNYDKLKNAISINSYQDAFEAAHTIKGLAANLGFVRLYTASAALTEKLRAQDYEELAPLFEDVCRAQEELLEKIEAVDD